VTVTEEVK